MPSAPITTITIDKMISFFFTACACEA
jgi:hypothetical protein